MTQSLDAFISSVGKYGIARNNKYEVFLPSEIGNVALPDSYKIAMVYAESIDIPGKYIDTIEARLHGKSLQRPMQFKYSEPLKITFLVDTRMQIRNYFDTWLNLVFPNGDKVGFGPAMPETYRKNMFIHVIDFIGVGNEPAAQNTSQNPIDTFLNAAKGSGTTSPTKANVKEIVTGRYEFFSIYPKSVSGLQSSNAGRDFQRITVTFEFDYMVSEFNENGVVQTTAPSLTKGTGVGLLGSLNGIAGSAGSTVAGITNAATNIGSKISGVLGL